jgi:hypothetical protein
MFPIENIIDSMNSYGLPTIILKPSYLEGETTLFWGRNANLYAEYKKKYRYFEGVQSLIWGRNNAILVKKQRYYLYRMPKTTSLFWGRTLAISRVKQRYYEG